MSQKTQKEKAQAVQNYQNQRILLRLQTATKNLNKNEQKAS